MEARHVHIRAFPYPSHWKWLLDRVLQRLCERLLKLSANTNIYKPIFYRHSDLMRRFTVFEVTSAFNVLIIRYSSVVRQHLSQVIEIFCIVLHFKEIHLPL